MVGLVETEIANVKWPKAFTGYNIPDKPKAYLSGKSEETCFLLSFCWPTLLPYELVLLLSDTLSADRDGAEVVAGGVLLRLCGGVLGGVRLCGGVRLPNTGFLLVLLLLPFSTGLSSAAGDEDFSVISNFHHCTSN